MTETLELHKDINNKFDQYLNKSDSLKDFRKDALSVFNKLGFPTTRNEEWKYTNLTKIASLPLEFHQNKNEGKLTQAIVDSFKIGGNDVIALVFENGIFNAKLSDKTDSSNKFTVQNLASSFDHPIAQEYLGKVAAFADESLVALNSAFINDGLFLHIPANVIVEKPIHFIHINTSNENHFVATIRNLIVAEKGSKVEAIESFHSLNSNCNGITNCVTEVIVKQNANVELVKAQLESDHHSQINFTQVIQERDSIFDTVTVTLSGELVRNNLHIKLNDENCTSHLFGLYILNGEQLVDNHTLVDHAMPHCFSNELYKGVIGGKASGVFNGKVFVRKDAQKTNAYQSNKTILLTDDAQMNTKPQLEIYADDVKCTHGATTGQMDEDALFYLRARGIGEQNARALLNIAFVSDVLNNIKCDELRGNLQQLAEQKLNS